MKIISVHWIVIENEIETRNIIYQDDYSLITVKQNDLNKTLHTGTLSQGSTQDT